ncbi:MliC family protein [Vibrio sp. SCSIO 43136]|uniref:MliC family protein n=1 Tax=Vibrio sp. SCSIO 43136 TaxID=2819101 RepID=UPI002075E0EB|nr:MliC family protein [Vibrio sp. SCSIO 43136]USD64674.1 MliC family protein [Vibrio sp. SCSIO 43136]
MKRLLMLGAAALLSGCVSEPPVETQSYLCANDLEVEVTPMAQDQIEAYVDGKAYLLNRTPSASGEKYQSPQRHIQLWLKGRQASLKWNHYPIQICVMPNPHNNLEPINE